MKTSDKNIDDSNSMNECSNQRKINATEVLQKFGKFQILSFAMLCPAAGCVGMSVMAFVFLNIIPEYECEDQQNNVNVSTKLSNTK